jgi:hypothetical protein
MSKPAARRAARLGLPFAPPVHMPELEAYYYEQLEAHGRRGYVYAPPADVSVLFIDEDPERAWHELGRHFLVEAREYGSWHDDHMDRPLEFSGDTIEALRANRTYEIITPEECLERHRRNRDMFAVIHPLVGGMPLERGWSCLELYAAKVLAPLAQQTGTGSGGNPVAMGDGTGSLAQ